MNNSKNHTNRKVLLWGMGDEYDSMLNLLRYEIDKGNIELVAIVVRKEDRYCGRKDGFYVIDKKEMGDVEFDYLVIISRLYFQDIKKEAIQTGISPTVIINGSFFHLPYFDFIKYVSLIENPVTILSDDCWGGYVYHLLGLPFSSPLINTFWDSDEFAKFVTNPCFFLKSELKKIEEGNLKRGQFPTASMGETVRKLS